MLRQNCRIKARRDLKKPCEINMLNQIIYLGIENVILLEIFAQNLLPKCCNIVIYLTHYFFMVFLYDFSTCILFFLVNWTIHKLLLGQIYMFFESNSTRNF